MTASTTEPLIAAPLIADSSIAEPLINLSALNPRRGAGAAMRPPRSSQPSHRARAIPSVIGKYRIERVLGEGATSTVYLGHDDFAKRPVAVKLIHFDRLAEINAGILRRLLATEASLIGKLRHPHIVQIFDAVLEAHRGYLVMEYVAGPTLERFCAKDAALEPDRVAHLMFKCSRALAFAHSRGVIHRDIKPANLLLAGPREVKISDFGTAMQISAESTVISGVGSPAYMSPEQVRDDPVTHQTDIYSLGVVMYQLLAGHLPFQASNHYGLMYQIAHGTPTPFSHLRPDLPAAIGRIVHRAIARDLTERYAQWSDFSTDLATLFKTAAFATNEVGDSEKFSRLRNLPFFVEFEDSDLWEVVGLSVWHEVVGDRQLLSDGEPGDFFCIIADGEVKVTKHGTVLSVLTTGDCFGEMAYLQPQAMQRRNADVISITPTSVVIIPTDALKRASTRCHHRFDAAFIRLLVTRLNFANERLISTNTTASSLTIQLGRD